MSQYLSRGMRNNLLFLNGMLHKADHIISELAQHNEEPGVLKNLRAGRTFIAKGMGEKLKSVDPKSLKQLQRDSSLLDVTIKHRSDVQMLYNQFFQQDREMRRKAVEEHGGDPVYDLAEMVLVKACMTCNGKPRKKGCPVYEALHALEIAEWDMKHPLCKYAGAGVTTDEEESK